MAALGLPVCIVPKARTGVKRGANFYASRVTPVDGEIRPVNQAVRYLIRAR